MQQIILSAALEIGMDAAGGKLFDMASKAGSKFFGRISRSGTQKVYKAADGSYVGITNDIARREGEHGFLIDEIKGLGELDPYDARAVEQVLIERYGLGNLKNKKNGIDISREDYEFWKCRGEKILEIMGL